MATSQLEGVIKSATAALTDWNSFIEDISSMEGPNQAVFDLEANIPGLSPPTSIRQLETKLTGAIGLVHNLSGIESLELIPDQIVTEVTAKVSVVRNVVEKLLAHLNALDKGDQITALDAANMTATNQKNQSVNLPPIFIELYPSIQNLLTILYQIRTMSGLNEEHGFALQLSQIDSVRSAQRKTYGELNRLRRALSGSRQQLDTIISSAQSTAQEIASLKDQASGAVQKADEAKTKADALVATTTNINGTAGKLKEAIDAYQATYTKFQIELDERNKTFIKGKADLEKLLSGSKEGFEKILSEGKASQDKLLADGRAAQEKLLSDIENIQKEIDRLLARSRAVLGETTVTGLSESFGREMKETGKQLLRIQLLFFFSIAFLLASVGILFNAFPQLEKWVHVTRFEPPQSTDLLAMSAFYLVNFLSKLTFLLPALLLLYFATRRYTEIFRLKTQYTHKFTVAASLTGFKLEAPKHGEDITAFAFKELLSNPAINPESSKDKGDKEESSLIQKVIESVPKKIMDKMNEEPKSPKGQ